MTLDNDVARLACTRPFNLLPREAVQLIAFSCEKRRLSAGEALFFPGEIGDTGYFVLSGAILLTEVGAEPREARHARAGALIGESALYASVVRQVEARAVEDALLMRVRRETFHRVLAEFPEAAGKVRASLGARMRQLVDGLDKARIKSFAGAGDVKISGRVVTSETRRCLSGLRAPTLEDLDALAEAAFAQLPGSFRRLCEGLVIQVVDFPDDDTLDEMGAQSEFDLLGLFRGQGLAQRGAAEDTGALPNMIWLYRRPLLDFWCEGEDSLEAVVTHVLVHEIGHHFGLSDADIEAIERSGSLIDSSRR